MAFNQYLLCSVCEEAFNPLEQVTTDPIVVQLNGEALMGDFIKCLAKV